MQDLPLFYAPEFPAQRTLPEAEAGHCIRVLRCESGDELLVTDGRGALYRAEIASITKKHCTLAPLEQLVWEKPWMGTLSLCIAPTKASERMEWLVEKAVEIGVDKIILLRVKHSERKSISTERLKRVMLSAMKQSQKALLPELYSEVSLEEALALCGVQLCLLAHCRTSPQLGLRRTPDTYYKRGEDTAIFIGPEGDFTETEIALAETKGAKGITFGDNRLRTETAALVGLQWIHTLQLQQSKDGE